jgi:ahcY: adenosylhomocysteinase
LCDGTPLVRDVELLYQPVPCADGAVAGEPRSGRVPPAQAPRRGGGTPASGQPRRGTHAPHRETGRLYRRKSRWPLQSRALPLL